jgi:hypothetical protein
MSLWVPDKIFDPVHEVRVVGYGVRHALTHTRRVYQIALTVAGGICHARQTDADYFTVSTSNMLTLTSLPIAWQTQGNVEHIGARLPYRHRRQCRACPCLL